MGTDTPHTQSAAAKAASSARLRRVAGHLGASQSKRVRNTEELAAIILESIMPMPRATASDLIKSGIDAELLLRLLAKGM